MLSPLIETLRNEELAKIPDGFTAKSKLTPGWEQVQRQIMEEMAKCEEKVTTRCVECSEISENGERKRKRVRRLGEGVKWDTLRREHESIEEDGGKGMTEEKARRIKDSLEGLVISPVDKNPSEMAVI